MSAGEPTGFEGAEYDKLLEVLKDSFGAPNPLVPIAEELRRRMSRLIQQSYANIGTMEQILKGPDFPGKHVLDAMIHNTEAALVAAGEDVKERPKPTTFEDVESERLLDKLTHGFTTPEVHGLVKEELKRRLAKAEGA